MLSNHHCCGTGHLVTLKSRTPDFRCAALFLYAGDLRLRRELVLSPSTTLRMHLSKGSAERRSFVDAYKAPQAGLFVTAVAGRSHTVKVLPLPTSLSTVR